MRKYRDGWNDPPPTEAPKDWDVFAPTTNNYARRGLIAAATTVLTGLTYALMPIAFAVGGAILGLWWAAAAFYEWLDGNTVDEEPLRS